MKKVIEMQIETLKNHLEVYKKRGNQAAIDHAKELIAYYEKKLKDYQ